MGRTQSAFQTLKRKLCWTERQDFQICQIASKLAKKPKKHGVQMFEFVFENYRNSVVLGKVGKIQRLFNTD